MRKPDILTKIAAWGRRRLEPFDFLASASRPGVGSVTARPFYAEKTGDHYLLSKELVAEIVKEGHAYREFYRAYIDFKRVMEEPGFTKSDITLIEAWFVQCRDVCIALDAIYPEGKADVLHSH